MDIEPKLLRYLLAIARSGSFGRAAAGLGISQPALSVAIARLEDVVGAPVMERGRRGAQLNAPGEILARHAESLETVLATAREEVGLARQGVEGPLRVGGTPLATASIIPDALARLAGEVDRLSVDVEEGADEDLLERLERHQLDVVVSNVGLVQRSSRIESVPLFLARTVAVVRPEHPLAGHAHVALADLLRWPWVLPPKGGAFRLQLEALFVTAGQPLPPNRIEAAPFAILKRIVRKCDAVTLLSDQIVRPELEEGALVAIPLVEQPALRRFGLHRLPDRGLNRLATRFVEIALALAPGYDVGPGATSSAWGTPDG
jgi:DNA-binding transcriptional LysR family regulator